MKFAIVGCGNVGTHFAKMWIKAGHIMTQVHIRSESIGTLQWLNQSVENVDIKDIHHNADAILLAVPDDKIEGIAQQMDAEALIIQPSGTFDLSLLKQKNKATLWPIYSLVKAAELDYSIIPFAVECCSDLAKETLETLMKDIGAPMFKTTSNQRTLAHLTAVMANNFTNAIFQKSLSILKENEIDGSLLLPIIQQTSHRLAALPDPTLQTGPAKRGDYQTIQRHLQLLNTSPEWKLLYETMSNIILQQNEHREL